LDLIAILLPLGLLMFVAYRGYSVILCAPLCALLGVLLTGGPLRGLPFHSSVFMATVADFVQKYFAVFLLGAVFGKVMEMSGAAAAISRAIVGFLGPQRAMLAIVAACAVLTYGGVSLFVVAFAVYPLAASLFRDANLPKRLIPGTIALGSFTFTMDALPGSPQIQNVIPTTFFGTTIYAAPILGTFGAVVVFGCGMAYLQHRARQAIAAGEGYGEGHVNEPEEERAEVGLPKLWLAILPLVFVGGGNLIFTRWIPSWYGESFDFGAIGLPAFPAVKVASVVGIWSIELALLVGIAVAFAIGYARIMPTVKAGVGHAVGGALLATMNTASACGFGSVIATLPGFFAVKAAIGSVFSHPLVNEAVSVNVLAGITGSASGGLGIALAALGKQYLAAAQTAGISPEVLHRVASMASGGMDSLPHSGALITLLAITGLTHKQSYGDIFALTLIKTAAVFLVIGFYVLTALV
jgi:H+/gluconate symporter-like permease